MENIDPPELEQTLRSLAVGRISDIVRVGHAFAVYKITDRRDPVLDPYDQVSDPAHKKAGQYRKKEALDKLRKELDAKWGVTYLDPEFRHKGR
jgi:parvulin-like peptidyl-prolyl isomerase